MGSNLLLDDMVTGAVWGMVSLGVAAWLDLLSPARMGAHVEQRRPYERIRSDQERVDARATSPSARRDRYDSVDVY
eukprot:g64687.t1